MREVEALRIAPGPAHQIIEDELRDIDQHEAGQDLVDAEPGLQEGRDQAVERAADDAEQQHERQHPEAGIRAVGLEGEPAAEHGADHVLALGADVPEIGAKAIGQADGDERQRRRLDEEFLQRPGIAQGLEHIDVEGRDGRASHQPDDEAGDQERGDEGGDRRERRASRAKRRARRQLKAA